MPDRIERGTFFLVGASSFSLVANYLIYFILGRFLLGPELLGVYGVVISLISVIEIVLVKAVQQAVSKFVSERPLSAQVVRKKALKLIIVLDFILFALYLAGSGLIAAAFGDLALTPYIRLASLLFLLHPVAAVFMGCLNGLQRFVTQAWLRGFYTLAKLVLIVGLVYTGFGLFGAIGGFVLASLIAMIAGFLITRGRGEKAAFDYRRFAAFMAPIFMFSVLIDLLASFDLFAVKALTGSQSSLLAGYYVAASTIARAFPTIISAFTFAIFPLVSATTFHGNKEKTRFYIRNVMRYSLLAIAPVALLFASTSAELVSLIYSSQYLPGASALSILSIAFAVYTFFLILSTIIAAGNRPKTAMAIAMFALLLSVSLNLLLVPILSMDGAALATLGGAVAGLVLSALFVLRKFRALVSLKSVFRIAIATLVVFALSTAWPAAGLLLIAKYAVLLGLYTAILLLLREITGRDLQVVLNIVR